MSHIISIQSFLSTCEPCNQEPPKNLWFKLQRWSKTQPFWTIFDVEYKDNKEFFAGHYCIDPDANLHEILTLLAETGRTITIHQDYFEPQEEPSQIIGFPGCGVIKLGDILPFSIHPRTQTEPKQ